MRCDMLVGGTDKGYIRALVQFLLESKFNQFNITIVEDPKLIRDAINHGVYTIYLVEEEVIQLSLNTLTEEVLSGVFVLSEPMTKVNTHLLHPILKYQKARKIEEILLNYLREITTSELVYSSGEEASLVSFFSPSGGVGTTLFAQMYAQIKSSEGYKVLFLSLENHPSYECLFHSANHHNLSDYMVYLLCNSNWLLGLEGMISEDPISGVHYFKSVTHSKDLAEVDGELWRRWLEYMGERSDYNYIVIDLGTNLYDFGMEVLTMSDHRVFISGGDLVSHHKWQVFVKEMDQLGKEILLTNKSLICNQPMEGQVYMKDYDALFRYDNGLLKVGKDGMVRLNPNSTIYGRMGVLLNGL